MFTFIIIIHINFNIYVQSIRTHTRTHKYTYKHTNKHTHTYIYEILLAELVSKQ